MPHSWVPAHFVAKTLVLLFQNCVGLPFASCLDGSQAALGLSATRGAQFAALVPVRPLAGGLSRVLQMDLWVPSPRGSAAHPGAANPAAVAPEPAAPAAEGDTALSVPHPAAQEAPSAQPQITLSAQPAEAAGTKRPADDDDGSAGTAEGGKRQRAGSNERGESTAGEPPPPPTAAASGPSSPGDAAAAVALTPTVRPEAEAGTKRAVDHAADEAGGAADGAKRQKPAGDDGAAAGSGSERDPELAAGSERDLVRDSPASPVSAAEGGHEGGQPEHAPPLDGALSASSPQQDPRPAPGGHPGNGSAFRLRFHCLPPLRQRLFLATLQRNRGRRPCRQPRRLAGRRRLSRR